MHDIKLHNNECYVGIPITYMTYETLCVILKPYIEQKETIIEERYQYKKH